jgi:uncharacterized RDD family membrane protein YckC
MSTRYWAYAGPHGEAGPVSTDELALFLRERLIGVDTPVCPVEGMQWAPLSQWLPELTPFGARSAAPLPLPAPVQPAPALPAPAFPAPAPSPSPSPWEPPPAAQVEPLPFIVAPAPALPKSGWTDRKAHPWRRYWARMLDVSVIGFVTWAVIGFVVGVVAPEPGKAFFAIFKQPIVGPLLDGLLTLVVAIPGTALLLGLTGGTPGKWLFGVKIVRPDGRPIGVAAALWREIQVWFRGLGMGIPLVALFTVFGGYSWLKDDGYAPWDKPRQRVALHRPAGFAQFVLFWLGLALLIAVRVWMLNADKAA